MLTATRPQSGRHGCCLDCNVSYQYRLGHYWKRVCALAVAGEGIVVTHRKIEVHTTAIDHFCNQHQIEYIDLLKLDIQGAGLALLRGASGKFSWLQPIGDKGTQ